MVSDPDKRTTCAFPGCSRFFHTVRFVAGEREGWQIFDVRGLPPITVDDARLLGVDLKRVAKMDTFFHLCSEHAVTEAGAMHRSQLHALYMAAQVAGALRGDVDDDA